MSYLPRHPFQRQLNEELPPSISGAPAYSARNPFAALYQQELPPSISGWGAWDMMGCFRRCRCGRPQGHSAVAPYGGAAPQAALQFVGPQMTNLVPQGSAYGMSPPTGMPFPAQPSLVPQGSAYGTNPPMGQPFPAQPSLVPQGSAYGMNPPMGQPFPAQPSLTPAQVAQAAALADPGPPQASEEIAPFGAMGSPAVPRQTVAGIGLQRVPGWQQSASHQATMARVNAALAAQGLPTRQPYGPAGAGGSNPYPGWGQPAKAVYPDGPRIYGGDGSPTNPYGQGQLGRMITPQWPGHRGRWNYG